MGEQRVPAAALHWLSCLYWLLWAVLGAALSGTCAALEIGLTGGWGRRRRILPRTC